MAGPLLFILLTLILETNAQTRYYASPAAMACGNVLSKDNEHLCRSFNGGRVCVWNPISEPKCRIGRDVAAANRLFRKGLSELAMPTKPRNAYQVINAAKKFAIQTGNSLIKRRAEEHEHWLRNGRDAFARLEAPQCLVNVPLCQRVSCGGYGSQTNAAQCLSDPKCCFDRSLYQYQYAFGSAFMNGAPTCYAGPSSYVFSEVAKLAKPWNPWYSGMVLDLFKQEIMKPITHSGMHGCSAAQTTKYACGWEGITKSECRLKDCCYTRQNTCVYPQKAVFSGLKKIGSYPELHTNIEEDTKCSANPFKTHSVYKRLSCGRLTSDPYSVLSCPSECCLDRTSIQATLRTNGYLSNRPVHGGVSYGNYNTEPTNQYHQYTPNYHGGSIYTPTNPGLMGQMPQNMLNSWNPVTPELKNMISAITGSDSESPKNAPSGFAGDPSLNLMMQMMQNGPRNSPVPMPGFGNPTGLDSGILDLYLSNSGKASAGHGRRSLNPSQDTLSDAFMAGLLNNGNYQAGNHQSVNPSMLYYLLNSKKNGEGLDLATLMQLGIVPFGKTAQGGQSMNPLILSMILKGSGDKSDQMSDAMKLAMMQGAGNDGNMATAMLLSGLMRKGDSQDDNDKNNLLLTSMLSNMMNKRGRHQNNPNLPHAGSNKQSYQNYPPHATHQQYRQRGQHHVTSEHSNNMITKPRYSRNDVALVDQVLSARGYNDPPPYCPYYFFRMGNFPDLSLSVRGCCKIIACHRKKEMTVNPAQSSPRPGFSQWTTWSRCDKTCGVSAFRTRVRSCLRGPRQLGDSCEGPARQLEKCMLGPCQQEIPGQSQDHEVPLTAGSRKGPSPSANAIPETKEDLNALMESLLHQLDSQSLPPARVSPTPTVNGHSMESAPVTSVHSSHTPPTQSPPQNVGKELTEEEMLQWMGQPVVHETDDKRAGDFGQWSTWSICDRECGGGRQIRMRVCLSNRGSCRGVTEEMSDCNLQSCESSKNNNISQGAIPAPSVSHAAPPERQLKPPTNNQHGHIPLDTGHQKQGGQDTKTLEARFVYGSWSSWTPCRNSGPMCTGNGIRTRQRNCFIYADDDVTPLPQENCKDSVQIDPCLVLCPPVDVPASSTTGATNVAPEKRSMPSFGLPGKLNHGDELEDGKWSEWSVCEGPCGEKKGISTRQRKCITTNDPLCDKEGSILKAQKPCTVQC